MNRDSGRPSSAGPGEREFVGQDNREPDAGRLEDMRGDRLLALTSFAMALALFGCGKGGTESAAPSLSSVSEEDPRSPSPSERTSRTSWRKERFISVTEAVERLQSHVDVPVILPRDKMAGLPNYKGWLADPKYLDWNTVEGVRAGTLTLRKEKRILILSYGMAGFDGCGDRSSAIETKVAGRPALVNPSGDRWSTVIWPVTETGSTGRYGISGTFDAVAMIRLAESMELARVAAKDSSDGC